MDQILKIVKEHIGDRADIWMFTLSGSRLYGIENENSDWDYRGIFLPKPEYLLGRKTFENLNLNLDFGEVQMFSLNHFLTQLEKGSPTAYELLFVENPLYSTPEFEKIKSQRSWLIGQSIIRPSIGYAKSEWETYIDKKAVTRKLGAKRRADIEKFGFSPKNAGHTIRILSQTFDLLNGEDIHFPLPEADLIRDIRNGQIPYEEIESIYQSLLCSIREAEKVTELPASADRIKIDELYFECIRESIMKFYE